MSALTAGVGRTLLKVVALGSDEYELIFSRNPDESSELLLTVRLRDQPDLGAIVFDAFYGTRGVI